MTSQTNLKTYFKILIPLVFLVIGILADFYPIIMSHFHLFWADDTDGLLHIYLLEHNLSWFLQQYPHLSLFSPPFFYPDRNVLMYSDPFITATPFYALFRPFFDEKNSFSCLLMLIMSFNFLSFYFLLKNKFKLNVFASSLGAYIFAFSLFNYLQLVYNHHSQMLYLFFAVLSLYSLLSVNKHNTVRKNCFLVFLFYLFIVLSVYSVYVITWYYCFSLFLFMLSMLFFKRPRRKLIIFIKRFWKLFAVFLIPSVVLLIPLIYHYQQFNVVWDSYSANSVADFFRNYSIYNIKSEEINDTYEVIEYNSGIEYITLFFGLWGLFCFKRFRTVILFFLIILFILSTNFEKMQLWYYIFNYFPGANGIRMNERIITVFYSFIAFGCAVLMNNLCKYKKYKVLNYLFVVFAALVLCAGQISYKYDDIEYWKDNIYNAISYTSIMVNVDKYSELIKEKDCKIISVTFPPSENGHYPEDWLDILNMKTVWIAHKNKVYTLNGYSGYKPEEPSRELTDEEEAVLCRFELEL